MKLNATTTRTMADADRVDLPPVAGSGVVDAVGQHHAPVGRRRRHAEAEEAQRREEQDRVGDLEGGVHDDRADRVRHDVAQHDAPAAAAHDPDGLHVLADAQRQRLAPDQPGRDEPGHEGEDRG